MKASDFDYNLPEKLIAQEPAAKRQMSRLLVLDRNTGIIEHKIFKDIVGYLNKGDCLVLNDTKVMPARLLGSKEDTDGKIEFVLLKKIEKDIWEVILKPGRRANPGARFQFGNGVLRAEVLEIVEEGNRIVRFFYNGVFEEVLDKVGVVPLPPYIRKRIDDIKRYQTIYARHTGSAAAPTAGLHFTKELLGTLVDKGVDIAYLTLHIGLGTFRPVKVDNIEDHKMHSEYYQVDEKVCNSINNAKEKGHRVIAVGTTSLRVLETIGDKEGHVKPSEGWTDIFIYPGFHFNIVDALITNFHLPRSTLLMLVSALAGRENIIKSYQTAIEQEYRFFSFGDAMFIK